MEGKAVLFKRFAGIDVFDIEVATEDPEEFIRAVKLLEPTFGGINLEDIKAPECFEIERRLKAEMNIPVFHDDQHGTAIISGAALVNALEIAGKRIEDVKLVLSGAGAAAFGCLRLYLELGIRKENIILCDRKGVIYRGRPKDTDAQKMEFAAETTARTLRCNNPAAAPWTSRVPTPERTRPGATHTDLTSAVRPGKGSTTSHPATRPSALAR